MWEDLFFFIGEYGPLFVLIFCVLHYQPLWCLVAGVILLEWTICAYFWKWMLLPVGDVRPKYDMMPHTLKTTGMPSAHTSTMVVASVLCLYVLFFGTHKSGNYTVLVPVLLFVLSIIVVKQRLYFGYHSQKQVCAGLAVGILDALFWTGGLISLCGPI